MSVSFNVNKAYEMYGQSGGTTNFPDSLKKVLKYMQNDANINNKKEAAYLLATAKSESDYSLQRWEADYLCGPKGVPYKHQPCQEALDYYRSNEGGKSNYYNKGVDSTGVPYFGRGLIQLTNSYNYQRYGDMIGVDLVDEGDKALIPKNSYKIASAFLRRKTFKYVNSGELTQARKSVNGGTKGTDRTNASYYRWLSVLENPSTNFKVKSNIKKGLLIAGISLGVVALFGLGYIIYLSLGNNKPKKLLYLKTN
tara:strand:+ start:1724 stop:2482 length:759 start_codon:yes stop_codon:yes gene_type:complete